MGAVIVSAIAIRREPPRGAAQGWPGGSRQYAGRRIGRKADDDNGVAGPEGAEVEIFGTRAANQPYSIGPEQPKLVIEQFRHAAAASEAGNPDTLCRAQRIGCLGHS